MFFYVNFVLGVEFNEFFYVVILNGSGIVFGFNYIILYMVLIIICLFKIVWI